MTKKGYDIYTKAMLHMNGSDGSVTFGDEISKVWTANGNAQIDTAQFKFGAASGLFDGAGDYVDTPDHVDFDVGSGDFTIDFWVKRNSTGAAYVCGQADSAFNVSSESVKIWFGASNTVNGSITQGSTAYNVTSTATITDTNWHHIAIVRSGNSLKIYIDGINDGTRDVTGITANNSSYKFAIGRPGEFNGVYFNGWIDEFRFSKGIARWTANFTPPTSEY